MAVKDHSLDQMIIDSAKAEFLKCGYRDASLHKIAKNAHITTGALYTRYKNKDALFTSLVQDVIDEIKSASSSFKEQYLLAQQQADAEAIMQTISKEMRAYRELLDKNFDDYFLFCCRSAGSSVEIMFKRMLKNKITMTINYIEIFTKQTIDKTSIMLLMESQFYLFKEMLEYFHEHQDQKISMELIDAFQKAGWQAVFEKLT